MFPKLLLAALFLVLSAPQQMQRGSSPANAAQGLAAVAPPIKMGLWEATTTGTSMVYKIRSCVTARTYEDTLAKMPPGCTISNQVKSSSSLSGDVSCSFPNGASSTGHFDSEFPDSSTVHSTFTMTMTIEGHTMPMSVKTDSHFISTECGELAPGESKEVQ